MRYWIELREGGREVRRRIPMGYVSDAEKARLDYKRRRHDERVEMLLGTTPCYLSIRTRLVELFKYVIQNERRRCIECKLDCGTRIWVRKTPKLIYRGLSIHYRADKGCFILCAPKRAWQGMEKITDNEGNEIYRRETGDVFSEGYNNLIRTLRYYRTLCKLRR